MADELVRHCVRLLLAVTPAAIAAWLITWVFTTQFDSRLMLALGPGDRRRRSGEPVCADGAADAHPGGDGDHYHGAATGQRFLAWAREVKRSRRSRPALIDSAT